MTVDDHIPSEDFVIGKNPDSIRLTGLQLDEEFAAPQFLSIWGHKQLLEDGTALHTQILFFISFFIVLGSMLCLASCRML